MNTDAIATPIGTVVIVVDAGKLLALDFADYSTRMMALLTKRFGEVTLENAQNPAGISERVDRYFAGELTALDDVACDPGGTAFQQRVWQQLRSIKAGSVSTYGELASALDNPKAVRAVGMANSLNPVAIALPCHRVIGANGKLTGYAGGLARKRWLLRHEGVSSTQVKDLQNTNGQNTDDKLAAAETPQQLSVFSS